MCIYIYIYIHTYILSYTPNQCFCSAASGKCHVGWPHVSFQLMYLYVYSHMYNSYVTYDICRYDIYIIASIVITIIIIIIIIILLFNYYYMIITIIIIITMRVSLGGREPASAMTVAPVSAAANLRTKILEFRGFDSSLILSLRAGIPRPIGIFPEILSQRILVGRFLVGRLGVAVDRV